MEHHAEHCQHIPAQRHQRTERTLQPVPQRGKFLVDRLILIAVFVAVVYAPRLDRSHEMHDDGVLPPPVFFAQPPLHNLIRQQTGVVIVEVFPELHGIAEVDVDGVLIGIDQVGTLLLNDPENAVDVEPLLPHELQIHQQHPAVDVGTAFRKSQPLPVRTVVGTPGIVALRRIRHGNHKTQWINALETQIIGASSKTFTFNDLTFTAQEISANLTVNVDQWQFINNHGEIEGVSLSYAGNALTFSFPTPIKAIQELTYGWKSNEINIFGFAGFSSWQGAMNKLNGLDPQDNITGQTLDIRINTNYINNKKQLFTVLNKKYIY